MKFVAPEQAPEQAEIIRNTPFWPDVDLSEFRSVMRTDGTVTQPRLKQVTLSAISEVNAELYEFRRRQQMLGYASLAEVPAEQLDGKSERIQHYFNAVYCWARAMLNERYQDYDATASGVKRGEELAEASGDLWRDARWAISRVAARHKLKMALGKDLSDKPVEHIDQTNESDGSFLMRLARQYGAIASVKNGNLLFIRQGQGKSATGKPLPVITITRKDGDSHRFTLADRGAYTGVIASWLHTREPAKKESTTVKRKRRTKKQKKEPEAKQGDYLVGTDENVLVLNRTYANRSNAERAAKMQWERLQRGVASFSLQLAEGRADLYTEMPVKVSGFKQPIDDAEWTITTLTHTVSPDNGFTTSLELEVRIDDFEME